MVQANQLAPDVSLRQMVCVMMMAGSTDFLTPIGYQTNMMVRPYGNYKFLDYTKFGFLLSIGAQLIAAGMTLVLID
jgi:di/tricarboxylate transporter